MVDNCRETDQITVIIVWRYEFERQTEICTEYTPCHVHGTCLLND